MNHRLIAPFFVIMMSPCALAHEPGQASGAAGQPSRTGWVEITEVDGYRIIKSNALPDHAVGRFPNRGNPNSIKPQSMVFRVPITPTEAPAAMPSYGIFGVALNGVPFEPGTAEFWKNDRNSGWHMEVKSPGRSLGLDQNNAHVQPTGMYHYHGPPIGLMAQHADGGTKAMNQLGWAGDGYPIYTAVGHADPMDPESSLVPLKSSWQLKPGQRPSPPTGPGGRYDGKYEEDFVFVKESGNLDERNGRFGVTPEFPEGTYYYVVTEEFPFISRSFKGVPDRSFQRKGHQGGSRPGRGAERPGDGNDRRGRGGSRGGPRGPGRGGSRGGPPQ